MSLENDRQWENTRLKLAELVELRDNTRTRECESELVRELTIRSLNKRINQFKEEMIRYEIRVREAAKMGG